MRIGVKIETISLFVVLLTMALLYVACTPPSEGQQPSEAVQLVTFQSASVKGKVEVGTPAGLVTVDLETGVLGGNVEGARLVSLDLEGSTEISINGSPQNFTVVSHGSGQPWAQCVEVRALVGVMGIGLAVAILPPGLPEVCGKPYFEVVPVPMRTELVVEPADTPPTTD